MEIVSEGRFVIGKNFALAAEYPAFAVHVVEYEKCLLYFDSFLKERR